MVDISIGTYYSQAESNESEVVRAGGMDIEIKRNLWTTPVVDEDVWNVSVTLDVSSPTGEYSDPFFHQMRKLMKAAIALYLLGYEFDQMIDNHTAVYYRAANR